MVGFETVGNATVTVFDDQGPVLTTDPWIDGTPYFGSWGHKYTIPRQQRENIRQVKYTWLSHGHPDHIDAASFKYVEKSILLIPDHYGNRIFDQLNSNYQCQIVPSNEWLSLSKQVRIKSFADWNQDAALIIDIAGQDVILNINDSSGFGWATTIKQILSSYANRFLLQLNTWGDATHINLFNDDGAFIEPAASQEPPVGRQYSRNMKYWGCNFAIPFSSFHQYVRTDSIHMNRFVTPLDRHSEGFDQRQGDLLPAFIRWDSMKQEYERIDVEERELTPVSPEMCGDSWSDQLEKEDRQKLQQYFSRIEHLGTKFGAINIRVGGEELRIPLSARKEEISFEAPRKSLVTAVEEEIFDDMLIGNYMKTCVSGVKSLTPEFTPFVTKYSDNGRSASQIELQEYFRYYRRRSANYWKDMLKAKSENLIRTYVAPNSETFRIAKSLKHRF